MATDTLSGLRDDLASFDHAYAVAVQLRETTGAEQLVIRTGNTIQPFRVSRQRPRHPEEVLALVA
jgi:hypothetical protein